MNYEAFQKHLIWAEGWENFPYKDSVGKTTIGVGFNIEDTGLSDEEIGFILQNRMRLAVRDCVDLPYWDRLDDTRKLVIADMRYNLGMEGLRKFVRMHEALERGDYSAAADEMVDSHWYRQTGRRARKLVEMMRQGNGNL